MADLRASGVPAQEFVLPGPGEASGSFLECFAEPSLTLVRHPVLPGDHHRTRCAGRYRTRGCVAVRWVVSWCLVARLPERGLREIEAIPRSASRSRTVQSRPLQPVFEVRCEKAGAKTSENSARPILRSRMSTIRSGPVPGHTGLGCRFDRGCQMTAHANGGPRDVMLRDVLEGDGS